MMNIAMYNFAIELYQYYLYRALIITIIRKKLAL